MGTDDSNYCYYHSVECSFRITQITPSGQWRPGLGGPCWGQAGAVLPRHRVMTHVRDAARVTGSGELGGLVPEPVGSHQGLPLGSPKQGNDVVRRTFWEDGLVWWMSGRGEAGATLQVSDTERQPGRSHEMGSTGWM